MNNLSTVILAAGLSRRMGTDNKLLLPVCGVPMIRHMVGVYSAVTDGAVIVITGHEAQRIESALAGSVVQTVFNPDYNLGQHTSVACGLNAVPEGHDLLVGLGDQPLLRETDLHALIDAHKARPGLISIPQNAAQRGNPIVIPAALRARLLADPRNPGCRSFTRQNPEQVQFHDLPAAGFYADVDTPEAYAAFERGALEPVP